MAGLFLSLIAAAVIMYSACTEDNSGDTQKSSDSSLSELKIGDKRVTLGTGNAEWAKVVAGSLDLETTGELTVTATNNSGASVKFAKINSETANKPEFGNITKFTFTDGDYLAVEVTAENGDITYYKIKITITPPIVDPKEKFHVYIAFGQSNMVGYLGPPIGSGGNSSSQTWVAANGFDTPPENFVVMAAANTTSRNPYNREMGKWYEAKPPLVRNNTGLSPADFFGRTVAEAVKDQGIKVGIIVVAVDGCKIQLFAKDKDVFVNYVRSEADWMRNQALAYVDSTLSSIPATTFNTNDYPYQRLVDLALKAQEEGVIKGIIMHQGESGGNMPEKTYAQTVRQIYDDLCDDLGLEKGKVPFLAGQAVGNRIGTDINLIPGAFTDLPDTAFVISSDGCTWWSSNKPYSASDNETIHFSFDGYKKLGTRYGVKMLELLYGITVEPEE
jgi:hypothetical protein